jgi:hypothetical protein
VIEMELREVYQTIYDTYGIIRELGEDIKYIISNKDIKIEDITLNSLLTNLPGFDPLSTHYTKEEDFIGKEN